MNKRGILLVLSGPSGVGKGTIGAELLKNHDDLCFSVSATTRAIRGGEVEGDWSQAAFFLAMGVEVKGLKADSHQGDRAVVGMLAQLRGG